jgi:beta-carotene 3-hydroxylase
VSPLALALAALAAMEPAVALLHRSAMHGPAAWRWHRSHHQPPRAGLEANDLLPLAFAAVTIAVMALGAAVESLDALVWIGTGVTAYGALYLVVHDLYIHRRLGRFPGADLRYVRWVARAHALHHRTGRAPYGFLVPVVPAGDGARALDPAVAAVLERSPERRIRQGGTRRSLHRCTTSSVPRGPSTGGTA